MYATFMIRPPRFVAATAAWLLVGCPSDPVSPTHALGADGAPSDVAEAGRRVVEDVPPSATSLPSRATATGAPSAGDAPPAPPGSGMVAPRSSTPEPPSGTRAATDLTRQSMQGAAAPLFRRMGGTYLCDQRIYARGGPHISAWEWAFAEDPKTLLHKLTMALVGSERDGDTFRFVSAEGQVTEVVTVGDARTDGSRLRCPSIPKGTRSLVVASTR